MTQPEPDPVAEKSRVQINYRSGLTMVVECDGFTVKHRGAQLTGIEWEGADLIPMHMGFDQVESIWQIS